MKSEMLHNLHVSNGDLIVMVLWCTLFDQKVSPVLLLMKCTVAEVYYTTVAIKIDRFQWKRNNFLSANRPFFKMAKT